MRQAFHTGWEALFWKEWRQQRVAALLLGLFGLLGYLGYSAAFRWEPEGLALMALLVLIAPVLGASAFAADEEAGAAGFTSWLPVARGKAVLVKYLVATGFCLFCLVPPCLVFLLLSVVNPRGNLLDLDWRLALLLIGSAIAVTGALTREGQSGMGTLLFSGVLLGISYYPVQEPRDLLDTIGGAYNGDQTTIVIWIVAHLWLWRAWSRKRTPHRAVWRRLAWPVLLVLAPPLADMATGHAPRILGSYGAYLIRNPLEWDWRGDFAASPAPDGKTIVLTARMSTRNGINPFASWLLDVATGRIRRVGPRLKNCAYTFWRGGPASWSPDGQQVRLYVFVSEPMYRNDDDRFLEHIEELVVEVQGGGGKVVRRRGGFRCHWSDWLGNGTNVDLTPTAWEFTDPATGEVRRCLHEPGGESLERVGRRAWLESAVLTVAFDKDAEGKSWLRVWRSAPELDRTEQRDLPVDPALAAAEFHPQAFSPDGRWLLAVPPSQPPSGTLGLFSLDDGSGRILTPEDGCDLGHPTFTGDSSRLVVPGRRSVQVWNLASERWEAKTPLPESFSEPPAGRGQRQFHIAVSPQPPWRVAVSANDMPGVYLASLADTTLAEVFQVPTPKRQSYRGRRLFWLGNDRLLVELDFPYQLWIVELDGTSPRRLLP